MSVEQPLWRALTGYRLLTLVYAVALFGYNHADYTRPLVGAVFLTFLAGWTLATLGRVSSAERCTRRFLACDITVAVTGIMLSRLADPSDAVGPTLPSIWVAGSVLAFAIKGGWRWAAGASLVIGAANVLERGAVSRDTVHNVLLVLVASIAIGYVVEVARASERTLAEALRVDAATRERERLARDIHDGVLQVLAMVQRRGTALGGDAADLGRLAGEQEVALRTLVASGPPPGPAAADAPPGQGAAALPPPRDGGVRDLRELLAGYAGSAVSLSAPGEPVPLPEPAAGSVAAAVGAALDNVRVHAGDGARAWILVEDEGDAVLVTVRDDGPGIPAGRLAAAEAEGRMGVSLSIRGRLEEVGGSARWESVPGQGTEVELKVPRHD
ncbi:DUF5931 domain-containing protein [Streptomyces sp. 549]|uniref:MacS family sensor histidine kinase n=1 Tax=Streptomyces sp. 549 TaxID=3049076 RepID=UPI0024C3689D|nr:DUF5931 domain-containing protein [Streptomyces sp. 549]